MESRESRAMRGMNDRFSGRESIQLSQSVSLPDLISLIILKLVYALLVYTLEA